MTMTPAARALRLALTIAACVSGGVFAASCGLVEPEDQLYTVAVDSMTGPDTVAINASYVQRLWGPVASNGCGSIDKVLLRSGDGATEIRVQGRHRIGDCESTPSVYMQGQEVKLTAPATAGPHLLRVYRPGTLLLKTVVVK